MVVLKIVGKILMVPVWMIVAIIWIVTKTMVSIYSFARGIVAFGLIALAVGTILCYQDWQQFVLLVFLVGFSFVILTAGLFFETILETIRKKLGQKILL